MIVGWREWVSLPELGIEAIKAKVDTGARSSSLHAEHIETFTEDGRERVRFKTRSGHVCIADVADSRAVRSSTGQSQVRIFIRTTVSLGGTSWPIDISLTSRKRMVFGMLLGREAMRGRIQVKPGSSFLQGTPIEHPLP